MTDSVSRGLAAKSLLENELFREVMNQLDDTYTAAWRAAKTVEAREDAHRYVILTEKFISDIQTVATTGMFTEHRQRELEGKKKGILPWPMS